MNKSTSGTRRTQSQRREETRQAILDSAGRQFGKRGFAGVALDAIARDAGVTEGPVYHYFKNKKQLFTSVTEMMEAEFAEEISSLDFSAGDGSLLQIWDVFLAYCQRPHFVQVVLIDAPHVLGRERWKKTRVTRAIENILAASQFFREQRIDAEDRELLIRIAIASLAEVAMTLARNPSYDVSHVLKTVTALLGAKSDR